MNINFPFRPMLNLKFDKMLTLGHLNVKTLLCPTSFCWLLKKKKAVDVLSFIYIFYSFNSPLNPYGPFQKKKHADPICDKGGIHPTRLLGGGVKIIWLDHDFVTSSRLKVANGQAILPSLSPVALAKF